jgi:hypothetical protein
MIVAFAVFAGLVTVLFGIFYVKARSSEPAADRRKNRDDGGDGALTTSSTRSNGDCDVTDAAGCDGSGGGGGGDGGGGD